MEPMTGSAKRRLWFLFFAGAYSVTMGLSGLKAWKAKAKVSS